MVVRTRPTMSPGLSSRVIEAITLLPSSFRKRYISSYKTPSSSLASLLTLPIWKRTRGPNLEGEEAAPKRQQQQAAPVEVTTTDRPLGLGYVAARRCALELAEKITHSTFEIGQSSRSVPD
ncbi:hypothetical protein Tco_0936540, partial [Tanacetum coccineum]